MALPVSLQLRYWGVAAAVLGLVLWFLGDTLLPFILGGAIAYLLDPIADRMERWGLSRLLATSVITLAAIFVFVLAMLLIVPLLVQQAISLFNTAPQIAADLWTFLTTRFPDLLDNNSTIRQSLTGLGETIQARGGALVNGLASSLNSIVNIVVLIVVVPVVAFYLLLDWDNLVAKIDELIPRDHLENVRRLGREIDATLASFIRGQGTVCFIQGLYYGIALMLAGLELWHCCRLCGRVDLFHSLCRRLGGRWSGAGFGAVPVLGRLDVHWCDCHYFHARAGFRRQCADAKTRGKFRRIASGLADLCPFRFRQHIWLCRHVGRRAGRGYDRRCRTVFDATI